MKFYGAREMVNMIEEMSGKKISAKRLNDLLIEGGLVKCYRENDRNSGLLPIYFKDEDYDLKYVSFKGDRKDFFILKFSESGFAKILNFLNQKNI